MEQLEKELLAAGNHPKDNAPPLPPPEGPPPISDEEDGEDGLSTQVADTAPVASACQLPAGVKQNKLELPCLFQV